ncbi:hypothetical protein [Streptomyces sp. NPDC088794]|uniref:hypothetical protein n=1 Tax=Streptomyces sp. NPDC088794 TaxID=3365902 RepID=UPI00382FBB8A
MNIVTDLYLGWEPFTHAEECERPAWQPELRIDQGLRGRLLDRDLAHECPNEECDHASVFRRFTVRLICRGCRAVHIVTGEDVGITRSTTPAYGYGQDAREVNGLWLWPGEQTRPGRDEEPRDWLVTRTPSPPLTPADVAGTIDRYRTSGQHKRWRARAIPDPAGPYGESQLRWARHRSEHLSVDHAADWIHAQYEPKTVEVAV